MADTTAPILTSLDLPETVDLSNGDVTVEFSAGASDAGEIDEVVIWYNRDVSYDTGTYSFTGIYGIGDDWSDGQSTSVRTLPAGNAPGLVSVSHVVVSDVYGNERVYTKSQLDALGFDTLIAISNALTETLAGTAEADKLSGDPRRSMVYGFGGHDVLNGGLGADTMLGGLGSDTYRVDNAGDRVTEAAGQGTDLVQSGVSHTLGANVEKLALIGAGAVDGTGNELNNVLLGNAGSNALVGLAGNDVLSGGTAMTG
jgi:Ca2+-binding RTX toxin-like protein